jgi:hypothetical protein
MEENKNAYRLLVGVEGKRLLGRTRRGCIDRIKIDFLEMIFGVVNWIDLAQDRYKWRALVNAGMNFRIPINAWKLPGGCTTCDLSSG